MHTITKAYAPKWACALEIGVPFPKVEDVLHGGGYSSVLTACPISALWKKKKKKRSIIVCGQLFIVAGAFHSLLLLDWL